MGVQTCSLPILLGDAYVFVDPVFSSGVFIAMSSAELAAVAVDEALKQPERADRLFRAYQREVDRGIRRFSWLIYRFKAPAMCKLQIGTASGRARAVRDGMDPGVCKPCKN